MMYFIKTPFWLRWLYKDFVWHKSRKEKVVYLTFDDGPHETATPFVLQQLKQYNAKATFFCLGKNVEKHPTIYHSILEQEHTVGNHTYHHLNGWKNTTENYLADINKAATIISSKLFRPPYGRIKKSQAKKIFADVNTKHYNIIMWDVLSGDFDNSISKEKCLQNVINHSANGSIIVFHDSEKAFAKMQFVLPKVLEYFSENGFIFKAL